MGRLIDADVLCERLLDRWRTADKKAEREISEIMSSVVTPIVIGTPTAEPEWISVENRLPEEDGKYFCLHYRPEFKDYDVMVYTFHVGSGWTEHAWIKGDNFANSYVTHWMKIPGVPGEGE